MNAIRFTYVNWRGEKHDYIMTPEPALSFGTTGGTSDDSPELGWVISGWVIKRDDEPRNCRRTFKLAGMRNIEEMPAR